jgi:hypothetical protein
VTAIIDSFSVFRVAEYFPLVNYDDPIYLRKGNYSGDPLVFIKCVNLLKLGLPYSCLSWPPLE